jgi:hypothetical protein
MAQNKVTKPGGLSLDTSLVSQPEGTTRFVLNGVNETNEGDSGHRANEESNEACYTLPAGFSPIGEVYIGGENTLIFLVSAEGDSALAIADRNCNLNVIVNDAEQTDKFGFKIDHQISATFRLRRGCERVVYWADPKPRSFIIEKEENFKDALGNWNISKFSLFKTYNSIPRFNKVEAINSGGVLISGSYNVSIQYLDEDLNPTEFITSTEVVHIYNDSYTSPYKDIRGSNSQTTPLYLSTDTNKSIRVEVSELDLDFPFYRLAFTESNNGSGQISDTKYTAEISTRNPVFVYTGANFESSGTQQDIIVFNNIIESAEHIEQIENKLILSNVKGKQINYCALQRYASRIKADCILSTISLNSLNKTNPKHADTNINGVAYTPGEIHSFGVVYVFDDMTVSPVCHIPGRSSSLAVGTTFLSNSEGKTYFPMSGNNSSASTRYIDNDTCDNLGYWGVDSEGIVLKDKLVRHHRFPLRSEINKPLFTEVLSSETSTEFHTLKITVNGNISFPAPCVTDPGDPAYDPNCVVADFVEYLIEYVANGTTYFVSKTIEYGNWDDFTTPGQEVYLDPILTGEAITIVSIQEDGIVITLGEPSPSTGLTYTIDDVPYISETESKLFYSEVMNIEFSNIEMPSLADTGGEKIVGYYIVRNERTENEKTILDSGVLTSTMQNEHFVSHGLLMPDLANASSAKIKKDFLSIINPEFKFNNKTYTEVDEIIKEGEYVHSSIGSLYSNFLVQDVLDGTSYDGKRHKGSEKDNDGFDLRVRTKDNILKYNTVHKSLFVKSDIKEIFYLDALTYKNVEDSYNIDKDVFNVSSDNKIGILSLKSDFTDPIINTLPYVIFKRNIADPYSNFRTLPYYKESKHMVKFQEGVISQTRVANGDSYVTSMKYVNSLFYENRFRQRRTKGGFLSVFVGVLLVVVGVAAAIFSGGTSLGLSAVGLALVAGAGAAAITGGALLASSGIKQANWNKTYNELYDQGLRETIEDDFLNDNFKAVNPPDDEIRWYGEALTNLWFESSVNMSLRYGANVGSIPDFIDSPALAETGNGNNGPVKPANELDRHLLSKLTVVDQERQGGRTYLSISLPEIYQVNLDYYRRNKQKIFNHLPLEYDCCSDCRESFPHRTHWSEDSFQEELTDNYRTFLPNNYRDIEGETGAITDVFRVQNNLYIHTEEALWHLPQIRQERITGDILSFLGTGEFFSVPPRKIIDDSNSSAGTSHKWARIKTKFGVIFPSHKEKKWYIFDGQQLKAFSDTSMSNYFKENMNFKVSEDYYVDNGIDYPFNNNPSNPIGVGYLATYDTKKERIIISKKDFKITTDLGTGYKLCDSGDGTVIFNDFEQIITDKKALNFQYLGIEKCKLKFSKTILEDKIESRIQLVERTRVDSVTTSEIVTRSIFSEVDHLVFRFKMPPGLTDLDTNSNLISPFASTRFGWSLPSSPNIYFFWAGDNTGNGYESIHIDVGQLKRDFPNENLITFECRSYWHTNSNLEGGAGGNVEMDAIAYKGGYMTASNYEFINTGGTLRGNYIFAPVFINGPETSTASQAQTMGVFTYNILEGKLSVNGVSGGEIANETITEEVFTTVNTTVNYTEEVDTSVTTQVPLTTFSYVEGTPIVPSTINNSWTLSYSLKEQKWISWHSYLPSFYFRVQEKFYAWKQGGVSIYRFNKKNHYQTFFGVKYPFIVEYVDTYGTQTALCDNIMLQTEAKQYNAEYEEYFDKKDITFNKILVYNSHQISGLKNLIPKTASGNYISQQVKNSLYDIAISRTERNWNINEFRDIRTNYEIPMFSKKLSDLQSDYFIDKIVNANAINYNKDWRELESFRDKFLVVRLIFDTFDNTRLIMNFSVQDEKPSER